MKISFILNRKPCQARVKPRQRPLDMLRNDLRLTGTKEGCGIGEYGAYAVILDDRAVTSCLAPIPSVDSRNAVIAKDVGCDGKLDSIQEAVLENRMLQHGFYIPEFIVSAKALLDENLGTIREKVCRVISENLCRRTRHE